MRCQFGYFPCVLFTNDNQHLFDRLIIFILSFITALCVSNNCLPLNESCAARIGLLTSDVARCRCRQASASLCASCFGRYQPMLLFK